jgi:hypothetical protein
MPSGHRQLFPGKLTSQVGGHDLPNLSGKERDEPQPERRGMLRQAPRDRAAEQSVHAEIAKGGQLRLAPAAGQSELRLLDGPALAKGEQQRPL